MRPDNDKRVYLFDNDPSIVYLKNVINVPDIEVGEHTYYHDFRQDPRDFVKNNVLYYFPNIGSRLIIGKYGSIACGTKFLWPVGNHDPESLAWYPFPIYDSHWDNISFPADFSWGHRKQDIIIGNDVWLGFESLILPGVHIGDGAAVGARSIVTHDVPPYTIVAGTPARPVKKRFDDATIAKLLELKWWDLPDDEVNILLPSLVHGDLDGTFLRKKIYEILTEILRQKNPAL